MAQWKADMVAHRPKIAKLVADERLHDYVQDRLSGRIITADGEILGPDGPACKGRNKPHRRDRRWVKGWIPEQIARRIEVDFPHDESMRISHEAIYQALYVEGRGASSASWSLAYARPGPARASGANPTCHLGTRHRKSDIGT